VSAGRDVPVTVFASPKKPEVLDTFAELGVERALLYLPTRPRDETLQYLDELAEIAAR
jgi:hypothetical protein